MTIERAGRSTSPVHVHVDDQTPVHVHVKKPKKTSACHSVEVGPEDNVEVDVPEESSLESLTDSAIALSSSRLADAKSKAASAYGASNLRRSTATAKSQTRSKSPTSPWVPPPARSSKGTKYSWQVTLPVKKRRTKKKKGSHGGRHGPKGSSHRLEIAGPGDTQTTLRRSDLSTDEEDNFHTSMRQYEKKIDSLMSEVGTLKNENQQLIEVTLQKTQRELDEKDDMLEKSRNTLEYQEKELEEYRRELEDTEAENRLLRRSMDKPSYRNLDRSDDREQLMKKLVEVEMDGQAAAKQSAALKDMTRRLKEEKRLSSSDATMLTKQKDLLMDRLADFETSNRLLRKMLRDRHEQEAENLCLAEQRDLLLKKLSETEDNLQLEVNTDQKVAQMLFQSVNEQRELLVEALDMVNSEAKRLRSNILDKERALGDFRLQTDAQREENVALANLQSSLENTRAHLQKQLRQKEGDCNRLAVQVRTLESHLAQEKIEVDHLSGLLGQAKEKADRDKEALKKATRVQKQRASRSEDALEQLNAQLLERDTHIAELRAELDNNRSIFDKSSKEKAQLQAENIGLKTQVKALEEKQVEMEQKHAADQTMRMTELENIMLNIEDNSKAQVESATARLHSKTSEASTFKLENERLKTSLVTIEDKLAQADSEVAQLRANLRQYETLIDEYRSQMNKSRREADETMTLLDDQKLENKRINKENETELEKVKYRLQSRLVELEPIPELLRTTELKLHDANEKIGSFDRRNTENTKLIAELTAKVETQADQLGHLHEKLHTSQDDARNSMGRFDSIERKLREMEEQNRDLLKTVAKREEAIHQANMRLDEKTRENTGLNRQLEGLLADARRINDSARDKAAAKDRSTQSRLLDLEAQLSQSRAEIARLKREKDESERKFNSRLYDLKDRLEQAHSTNRSMQNYVQFLKSSYANVFGDQTVTTSSPLRSTFY